MNKKRYTLFCLFLLQSVVFAQTPVHKEMLGRPTDRSITVQMFFDKDGEMSVRYGKETGKYTGETEWFKFSANMPAEIELLNLEPNTLYYYQVLCKGNGSSEVNYRPEFSFRTQRNVGSEFTFVVQADPHLDQQSDTALYKRCLLNQLEDKPDFMIDLGDILMSDKLKDKTNKIPKDTVPYRCHLLRSYYENVNHSVPLFIVLGNHEGEAGWQLNNTSENVAVWGTNERKKYFLNPFPNEFYSGDTIEHNFVGKRENYYAWTWGDALFIVLDPYWYTKPKPDSLNGWRWTLGKTQYDWLHAVLKKSNSKFKFVFAHQLVGGDPDGRGGIEFADLYEWGGKSLDGKEGFSVNRPGWYKPIKDLLQEYKVTIFFHGHDHFFAKQEKDCLIYQETPQPSHPNFQSAGQADDYGYVEGVILPNSGHIRVNVNGERVKVEYVRAYLPKNETNNRRNKDVSASYTIGVINCYDSLTLGTPVLWNNKYKDELVYPNPFNEDSRIEFSVEKTEEITMFITDNDGKYIRSLLNNEFVNEGEYQVVWDGKNNRGEKVFAGVYWFHITGKYTGKKSGKMIMY